MGKSKILAKIKMKKCATLKIIVWHDFAFINNY